MKLTERIPDRSALKTARSALIATLKRWRTDAIAWLRVNGRRPKIAVPVIAFVMVIVATLIGVFYEVLVATLVVVIYSTVFAAISVIGWKPFEALPAITVGFGSGGITLTHVEINTDRPRPPIDIDACVAASSAQAQSTVAPRPKPPSAFELAMPRMDLTESYDTALNRFREELVSYEAKLRQWLAAYDSRRWPNHSAVRYPIVIHNHGESVADGITLNLFLPEGLIAVPDEKVLSVSEPPELPTFERRSTFGGLSMPIAPSVYGDLARSLQGLHQRAEGIAGPEYVMEGDQPVVRVRIETLTHGDRIATSEPVLVIARAPGTYTIRWTANVGNLRRPASGTITATIKPLPDPGDEQLRTLDEVLATGDVPVRS